MTSSFVRSPHGHATIGLELSTQLMTTGVYDREWCRVGGGWRPSGRPDIHGMSCSNYPYNYCAVTHLAFPLPDTQLTTPPPPSPLHATAYLNHPVCVAKAISVEVNHLADAVTGYPRRRLQFIDYSLRLA
ncbi:hypothetical protein J6590_037425, partial [Homalodisca vitripennis]